MDQPSIKAIDKVSVAKICSGQVIQDLATAVKELVENSLDAGAKHVEVKLKEFGVDLIEVSDNGSGISPSNYEGLALKYHTSKLASFSDLSSISSFGFRGEALSSLCELAGSFSVTTRTDGESVGVKLSYRRDGKLTNKETAPRQVGTTVSISNLFEPLPVRRGEFKRNIKKQYNRLLRVMQAYALVSLGVRITLANTRAKGGKKIEIATQYKNKLEDNITNVFGPKFLSTLVPLRVDLDRERDEGSESHDSHDSQGGSAEGVGATRASEAANSAATSAAISSSEPGRREVLGMISKAGEGVGRADNDRQFVFVNGRPVDLPKLTRAVNEVWRTYEMKHKPAFVLDVRLPPGCFDVNVTPDKREIFMVDEGGMIDLIKKSLDDTWTPSRYTIPVNQGQLVQARLTDQNFSRSQVRSQSPSASQGATRSDAIVRSGATREPADVGAQPTGKGAGPVSPLVEGGRPVAAAHHGAPDPAGDLSCKRPAAGAVPARGSTIVRPNGGPGSGTVERASETIPIGGDKTRLSDVNDSATSHETRPLASAEHVPDPLVAHSRNPKGTSKQVGAVNYGTEEDEDGGAKRGGCSGLVKSSTRGAREAGSQDASAVGELEPVSREDEAKTRGDIGMGKDATRTTDASGKRAATRDAPKGSKNAPNACLAFDLANVLAGSRRASRLKRKRDQRNASAYSFSDTLSGAASASDEDSKGAARAFSRVLRKEHFTQMQKRVVGQFNLGFIICLLGSDLFILDQHACDEKYNFEVLQETTTIHQQPLVRPLPVETTAAEEMTIMDNLNVFEKNGFRFSVEEDKPATKKLKITAVPFSKGTQFGVDDVHELASIVANNPRDMPRLPKARAMFASRACRSSIMIGKALDRGQMARVVGKMATIEQPWNCPHGRPTMRHLADVSKSLRTAAGLDALLEA